VLTGSSQVQPFSGQAVSTQEVPSLIRHRRKGRQSRVPFISGSQAKPESEARQPDRTFIEFSKKQIVSDGGVSQAERVPKSGFFESKLPFIIAIHFPSKSNIANLSIFFLVIGICNSFS
jgi:hypothetical protein